MGTVFTASGQSATPVVIMGGALNATITGSSITSNVLATVTGFTASVTSVLGGGTTSVSMTNGLSANFVAILTVNTTGSQFLAANPARLRGVWIQEQTASVFGLIGDNINSATIQVSPAGSTNSPPGLFIPGCGAIYAKASSSFATITGFWF